MTAKILVWKVGWLFALGPAAGFPAPPAQTRGPADDGNIRAYREVVEDLRQSGLKDERAFDILRRITDIGPRLTGSPKAEEAVTITLRMMEELGFDNVHAEPVTVNRWVRGDREEAGVVFPAPAPSVPLTVCALGGSVATPPEGLSAPVVEVRSWDELEGLGRAVSGKIVFFNRPMDRGPADPFAAYGGAADQRVRGASEAARRGAVAVLVRSLTLRVDDHPHTGLLQYAPGVRRIPAAAVSTQDADLLSGLLKQWGQLVVHLVLSCRNLGPAASANVVGDITGSALPGEIVLLGGHLDSWDLGTGAHDDGAGCAVSLEALRLLRTLGLRPKRTVRAVLFMDEEFGGTGGRFYVRAPGRKGEKHIVAMESDRGGFVPTAVALGGGDSSRLARMRAYEPLFEPLLGTGRMIPGGGGVDVGPLIERGAMPASVILNSQPYFDVHHSALDVLSSVHPRELELQAVILAALAFILAQEGV